MRRDDTPRIRGRRLMAIRVAHFRRHPLCVMCLAKTPPVISVATELDHIVPLFKGGEDVESNRQGLCTPCHAVKTAADMGYEQRHGTGVDGWPVYE